MSNHSSILILVLTTAVVSGCATISKEAGFHDVEKMVGQRQEIHLHWNQSTKEDTAVSETIHSMMREELTVDQAVQIALLNNPSLQATFEELGIAQAELVQAGLLENPVFAGHVRFPDASSLSTNTEFTVTENFLHILFLPLRKKLASLQFEQAKFRVGDAVIRLNAEVKSAYYTLQAAQQMAVMRQRVVQAAQTAAEVAERQYKAGNISELDLANEQALYQKMYLDLVKSKAVVLADREHLSRLLGLKEEGIELKIKEAMQEFPQVDPLLEELETLALSKRLDLAAAQKEIEVLKRALTLSRSGIIPTLEVGIDTERDADRTRVTGPSWELPIPIFDRRQGTVARTKAQLRQSEQRLEALKRDVDSEVRLAHNRLVAARRTAESYRDTLIPLREKIVDQSLKHYNYMLIGVFQLLQAKQNEIEAQSDYIEAQRDYWIAQSELERAVGGQLVEKRGEP